jgi:hypothetical protein
MTVKPAVTICRSGEIQKGVIMRQDMIKESNLRSRASMYCILYIYQLVGKSTLLRSYVAVLEARTLVYQV